MSTSTALDIRTAILNAADALSALDRARDLSVDPCLAPSARKELVRKEYKLARAAANRVIGRIGQTHDIAVAALDAAEAALDLSIEANKKS